MTDIHSMLNGMTTMHLLCASTCSISTSVTRQLKW